MRREGLDNEKFAMVFGDYVSSQGFGNKSCYNKQSVSRWRTGKSRPPLNVIDALYSYARERGYDDLEFYVSPNDAKIKRI